MLDRSMTYAETHYQARSAGAARTANASGGPTQLRPGEPAYPGHLGPAGPVLYFRGAPELLHQRRVAIFASIKSPGAAILRALAWARDWPGTNGVVISGFHSPIEQECMSLLLRRRVPLIVCPAREVGTYRLPKAWRGPLEDGRLLVMSKFAAERRVTASTSVARNGLVAHLADEIVVLHTSVGGQVEHLVRCAHAAGKPVLWLADEQHRNGR